MQNLWEVELSGVMRLVGKMEVKGAAGEFDIIDRKETNEKNVMI